MYGKLCPYHLHSLAKMVKKKLSSCFSGPFKIVKRIGSVAYRLELPPTATIHPVFHVSQLKKSLGAAEPCLQLPLHLDAMLEWIVEPEQVLEESSLPTGRQELLIQWKGLPITKASWEYVSAFNLEDKVYLDPWGIDKPPIK